MRQMEEEMEEDEFQNVNDGVTCYGNSYILSGKFYQFFPFSYVLLCFFVLPVLICNTIRYLNLKIYITM